MNKLEIGTRVQVTSDDYNGCGNVVGYCNNAIGMPQVIVQTDTFGSNPLYFYDYELSEA